MRPLLDTAVALSLCVEQCGWRGGIFDGYGQAPTLRILDTQGFAVVEDEGRGAR